MRLDLEWLERRDETGPVFQRIRTFVAFDQQWSNSAWQLTWGGACFNGSAIRSALQGAGPHRAPNFWYPLIVPTPSDVERRNSACNTHWREPCVRGQLRPSQGDMVPYLSTHIYTVWPPAAEDVMSAHVREGHVFMGLEVISHAIACCTNASRGLTAMAEFRSKQQWVKINFVLVLGGLMFVLSLWLSPW